MSLDDFKAKLTGGGARPNLFKVTCNFPQFAGGSAELASFMIKGASLPSSVTGVIEVPYRGKKLKVVGDRTFEPWTITVINDVAMDLRNAFERWSNAMVGHTDNVGLGAPSSYQVDMKVEQLDKSGNVTKIYNFRGAFPTNIGAIDLNYETNDAVEEFTVELNYQYWDSPGVTS